ncbi:zinc-ribbon domain-containing protein [Subtercola sp. YIM 133946]|uniref:zinc-ribbon domain-containing protein n=1 Tax=Subtercola sp. YIM 133946 TaxID=3118909 RepID=UPI003FCDE626
MLLIFGSTLSETLINVVTLICGYCNVNAPQNVLKRRNRLTLFFVPLFALSTKYVNQCTNCGAQTSLSADQAQHSLAWSQTHR